MDGWNGRTGIFTCVRGIAKGTEGERGNKQMERSKHQYYALFTLLLIGTLFIPEI